MKSFIDDAGKKMAIKTGDMKVVSHFKQIISLNIQKGYALADTASLKEICYL